MLKLLGAGLLMGGGLALGLRAAKELDGRIRALDAWVSALGLLEGELAFRLPAMPELLHMLSRRAASPANRVFEAAERGMDRLGEESFEDIWASALTGCAGGLGEEDVDVLCRLGTVLGRYSWEDQRQALEAVRAGLAARAAQVREELRQKGRAYGTLGLTLGTFLTILLV